MGTPKKITSIYIRVSTNKQSTRSQKPDLLRWVQSQDGDVGRVQWFEDKASGKTMNRPQWNKLQEAINNNRVSRLVVWRLDRLGRTASGLTKLFEQLRDKRIDFVSVKDGINLQTTAGRLIANVLASVACYENEVRAERVLAGQAVAKAKGKTWGGSKRGCLHKHTKEQVQMVVKLKGLGQKVSTIARTVGTGRQNIYRILKRVAEGAISI